MAAAKISFDGLIVTREEDLTLRITPNGNSVVNFRVPVTKSKKVGDDWIDENTTWYDCTAWGETAEMIAEHFTAGDIVNITGSVIVTELTVNPKSESLTKEDWDNMEWDEKRSVRLGSLLTPSAEVVVSSIGMKRSKAEREEAKTNGGGKTAGKRRAAPAADHDPNDEPF